MPQLDAALRSLADLCDDFQEAHFRAGQNALQRIIARLDEEPLAGFLRERLPQIDYGAWLDSIKAKGALTWPLNMPEKVAIQIALIRDLVQKDRAVVLFAHEFTNAGYNNLNAHHQKFGDIVLRPMQRDLERLAEERDLPTLLAPALGSLPRSGDPTLDALLSEAIARFKDSDPQAQAIGLERLWDAFERLKTLLGKDKRASSEALLEQTEPDPTFRDVLRKEMHTLSAIGNSFHIRHSEISQIELHGKEERDYLFHRMFALICFTISRRAYRSTQ